MPSPNEQAGSSSSTGVDSDEFLTSTDEFVTSTDDSDADDSDLHSDHFGTSSPGSVMVSLPNTLFNVCVQH